MAIPRLPLDFSQAIPNNPFFSPQTDYIYGANGPLIVGTGLSVNYLTGIISSSGGGGGPGTVTLINTGAGLTGGPITSTGTISLTTTTVVPATYTYPILTVDAYGRITFANSGVSPVTAVIGVAPISVTGTAVRTVSIAASSTAGAGAVQLYNNTNSLSTTLALTAAQGYSLQQQITALLIAPNLTLAGTLDPATGLMGTITSDGTAAGFVSGAALPAPALSNLSFFVIAVGDGTYDPPGPTGPLVVTAGDWLLSSGTQWDLLDIGPTTLYATTSVAGSVCLSTDALAQAGTDTLTALTPSTAHSAFVARSCYPATGSLVGGTSVANTPATLALGTAGQILTVDAIAATGFTWQNPAYNGTVTSVATGTGLSGGPITSTGTIALTNTAVTPGSYTYSTITVDAQGRLTAASSGTSLVATVTGIAPIVSSGGTTPAISLANTAVSPGSYTYSTITVDAKGRLTAASSGTSPVTTVTGTAPIVSSGGTTPDISLANTAVTPGSYTYSTITVDAQGRLTAASSGTSPVTSITAGTGLSGGTITTSGTIALANTAVTPGSYTSANITVDAQGRLTSATSTSPVGAIVVTSPILNTGTSTTPNIGIQTTTTGQLGAVRVGTNIDVAAGTISVKSSTTGQSGVVQLNNTVSSISTTEALTAAQGKVLQDQITALLLTPNINLAGTLNAFSGLVASVTSAGVIAGYTVGAALPAAALITVDSYVIVTESGTYTPPGGSPTVANRGDWFLVAEVSAGVYSWEFLNVGIDLPIASTSTEGIVELATSLETQTGTDGTRAVTPAGAAATYIPLTDLTAKGDILSATGANTPAAFPVGTNGQFLVACSVATTGLCWVSSSNFPAATPTVAGIVLGCTTAATSALGCDALLSNTTGNGNAATGISALRLNTTGNYNTALGFQAGFDITTGSQNVAIGPNSTVTTATASCQLAIGFSSTGNWLTGNSAKTIRPGAGIADCADSCGTNGQVLMSNGSNAVCWGSAGGGSAATPTVAGIVLGCTTATNSALGCSALFANTTGDSNTAIGVGALCSNTTGNQNTANGTLALRSNTTGCSNTATGGVSLLCNTTGCYNTANGTNALRCNTTGCSNTANGLGALLSNTTGNQNTANGALALTTNTTGFFNTAIGMCALCLNTTGNCNTVLGFQAGCTITTGSQNVAIGPNSTVTTATASCQLAIGFSSTGNWLTGNSAKTIRPGAGIADCANSCGTNGQVLMSNGSNAVCWGSAGGGSAATPTVAGIVFGCTTLFNSALGCDALVANTTGAGNAAAATEALASNTSGNYNTASGTKALYNNTTGNYNTALGFQAGCTITTGSQNVAIGPNSTVTTITASCQLAIGFSATCNWLTGNSAKTIRPGAGIADCANSCGTNGQVLMSNGSNAVCWGTASGGGSPATPTIEGIVLGCTTATNSALGCLALFANTTGTYNTATGRNALCSNTSGCSNTATGTFALFSNTTGCSNTAIGVSTLGNNSTGTCNTAIGMNALRSNTTGCFNTASGMAALFSNTTGANNTSIGLNALCLNTTGSNNTAIGSSTLRSNTTGFSNAAGGTSALISNTTGCANTAFGIQAGCANTTGSGNVMIGGVNSANVYAPVFGTTTESNRVMIGSTAVTNAYVRVAWTITSDARDKMNVTALPVGLDFVNKLNPVSFQFKENRECEVPHGPMRYGFLAQEILEAEGENPVITDTENSEQLKITNDYMNAVLVKAIQELSAEVTELKAKLS